MGLWSAISGIGGAAIGGLMGGPVGAGVGLAAGGSLGGAIEGGSAAKDINRQQVELAQGQMDFQERMSNTAHQREVADLRAAGLNPILSARYGGSSTPSGTMAQLINPAQSSSDYMSKFANAASAVNVMRLTNEQVNTQKEQTGLVRNNQNLAYFNTAKAAADARMADNDADISDLYADTLKSPLGQKVFKAGVLLNAGSAKSLQDIYNAVRLRKGG